MMDQCAMRIKPVQSEVRTRWLTQRRGPLFPRKGDRLPKPRFQKLKVNVCGYNGFDLELDDLCDSTFISPYAADWLNLTWVKKRYPYDSNGYQVEWVVKVVISHGDYVETVRCDVFPLKISHLCFGQPWFRKHDVPNVRDWIRYVIDEEGWPLFPFPLPKENPNSAYVSSMPIGECNAMQNGKSGLTGMSRLPQKKQENGIEKNMREKKNNEGDEVLHSDTHNLFFSSSCLNSFVGTGENKLESEPPTMETHEEDAMTSEELICRKEELEGKENHSCELEGKLTKFTTLDANVEHADCVSMSKELSCVGLKFSLSCDDKLNESCGDTLVVLGCDPETETTCVFNEMKTSVDTYDESLNAKDTTFVGERSENKLIDFSVLSLESNLEPCVCVSNIPLLVDDYSGYDGIVGHKCDCLELGTPPMFDKEESNSSLSLYDVESAHDNEIDLNDEFEHVNLDETFLVKLFLLGDACLFNDEFEFLNTLSCDGINSLLDSSLDRGHCLGKESVGSFLSNKSSLCGPNRDLVLNSIHDCESELTDGEVTLSITFLYYLFAYDEGHDCFRSFCDVEDLKCDFECARRVGSDLEEDWESSAEFFNSEEECEDEFSLGAEFELKSLGVILEAEKESRIVDASSSVYYLLNVILIWITHLR
ncbi:uncharacterized protein LOC132606345 [Lycium barbarum]|uniref:uncharacterized protein LOC132606345 n=1 Tax=Lycium barbarum TaxID=112863 RepID=UPI00293EA8A2|nr:uncharacterized protein LOC132606345 [Lycium barbarum]XP_060175784.1 uncharacterized protein LOC132606345 [Lycium barbarum]XP_060175785.1 uncharacterized protein LOC132606345 [Lycium barbarum]